MTNRPATRTGSRLSTVLIVFMLALIAMVAPASTKDLFTPDHVAKIKIVSSVVISPDGKHIAYTLSVPRRPFEDDNGPPWNELHVVDGQGQTRPFITGEQSVGPIQWTPDGSGIAFLAKRGDDEHRSLYVIPIDGGEARKILTHDTGIGSYEFSPDGKLVAFLATEKVSEDKKKLDGKGFNQEAYEEDVRFTRVWIAKPEQSDDSPRMLDLPGSASKVHFSPTGEQLVVALAPTPLIDDYYMKRDLHVIDVASGTVVARIELPGKLGKVAWSPDGKRLAMIAGADPHDPGEGRLMIAGATGGPLHDIVPGYLGHVADIAWQDDETVMFLGGEGVWTTFNEIRYDGAQRKTHIETGKSVLSRLTLSDDGKTAAFAGQSPVHPNEVFIMRHGETSPARLTESNPWFADMRFAKQEVVRFKARDGLEIEGILIRPIDSELAGNKRFPLILVAHGGPEGHYQNSFVTRYSSPGQVAAAAGYAVFYPNYRASTGRGVEFSKLDHGDFAGKEFDDLVDGVDHLIETGLVDKNRVAITGGSYGGYATAWCCTYYSDRFAAGVMAVGISNYLSKIGTTDIYNEMTEVHTRKNLWDDWDFFLKRSPVYYVDRARTPLLILHGKDDKRVNPGQSLELYRHMKVRTKTPVRLVWYIGEGHGNRKSAGRYDYNVRMMRWFDHYLKGETPGLPPYDIDYGFDASEDGDDGTTD